MTWKKRNINWVEQANIPKFSKLDDIVSPLRFLELFFDDVLVMIVGYTKLYSDREKADISFEITNEKIRHKLPDCIICWETTPDTFE